MLLEGFEREPDRLSYYLLGAVAVHIVLLAFGSLSSCRARELVEVSAPSDKLVNIDMEPPPPPVEHPPTVQPGGGLDRRARKIPTRTSLPRWFAGRRPLKAKAPPPKEIPREEEETVEEAPEMRGGKDRGRRHRRW